VIAHAAADDQNPLVPQRAKGAPGGQVLGRIEIALEREGDDRNVGVGENQQERNEDAVVEAARRIGSRRQAGRLQQLDDPFGEARISGGRILQLVGVGRWPSRR
jgi:hypothetical protein